MTDTLTLYLSQDPYLGDAQATVTINGVPTSGVRDVAAIHGSDNTQALTFIGNFGPAPQIGLSLINDTYAGAGKDLNLYLDGFTYDGVPQLGLKQQVGYDETVHYTLTTAPAAAGRASDFVNGIGVDTHLNYPDTPEGNVQTVAASLAYLGVTHINTGVPNAQILPTLQTLGAAGIKFSIVALAASSDALLPAQLAAMDTLVPYIGSIQGPNEVNLSSDFSWDGQKGYAADVAYQAALFAGVRADPLLKNLPVYGFSVAGVGGDFYQALGDIAPYETNGNMHVYFPYGTPPFSTVQYVAGVTAISSPGLQQVISETNYPTAPLIPGAVDDNVQGRYDLDLLMDATKQGIAATYFYELLDQQPDPLDTNGEDHFGLFNNDGTPKPVAVGLHNLTSILADTGAAASTFTPVPLSYSVTGLPASGDTLLLQKSDGTYELVVWAEPNIFNITTGFTPGAPSAVQVSLGRQFASVSVFDPLLGTAAHYANVSSVQVTVTDHPVVIQLSQAPTVLKASTVLGTGPDTLALFVAEDAFRGDAQFTVSVDGNQVGGIQTATASHLGNTFQELDVQGTFGPGPHQATVNFLNDLYVAGAGDRNLYVGGATIDGTAVAGSNLNLFSAGPQSFAFAGPPITPTVLGQGPDTLALFMSEDAYQGDAQFTVAVDGKQFGGVQTINARASHAAGASQELDLLGTFGGGPHQVSLTFLNDLYAPGVGDRNLYLNNATIDNTAIVGSAVPLTYDSTRSLAFAGAAIAPTILGQGGPNDIAVFVSEDAFQGDAQFTIAVDGTQYGGVLTVNPAAQHGVGATPQEFDILGTFAAGPHQLSITFLNDLYSPGAGDRNLYINQATIDGTSPPTGIPFALFSDGSKSVTLQNPPF